jgi:hypothetical protein
MSLLQNTESSASHAVIKQKASLARDHFGEQNGQVQ